MCVCFCVERSQLAGDEVVPCWRPTSSSSSYYRPRALLMHQGFKLCELTFVFFCSVFFFCFLCFPFVVFGCLLLLLFLFGLRVCSCSVCCLCCFLVRCWFPLFSCLGVFVCPPCRQEMLNFQGLFCFFVFVPSVCPSCLPWLYALMDYASLIVCLWPLVGLF